MIRPPNVAGRAPAPLHLRRPGGPYAACNSVAWGETELRLDEEHWELARELRPVFVGWRGSVTHHGREVMEKKL